ncbi:hypothetical protein NXG27_07690 [Megasphaera paucivorans]|uniref:Uncharacterized protein n=1 Tax=Megasphaera paucivorans TaxID=349095 RepID=A0A1H0AEJ8_9FIRM|nr:hypothetical protein [Megasphaera paucivorans]SDN32052.1 hypothetical protein SAMN05660299_02510 [Megasphaera paucivorans]
MSENVVAKLCQDVKIPKMVKVRQHFDPSYIAPEDIPGVVREELERDCICSQIKPGMSIAITWGREYSDCHQGSGRIRKRKGRISVCVPGYGQPWGSYCCGTVGNCQWLWCNGRSDGMSD